MPTLAKQSISLYFRQGGSDKEYHASIEPKDGQFVVNFAYGRRGSTLQTGTKTTIPVAFETATNIFTKLVTEKKSKGYTEGEAGTPYQHTDKQSDQPQAVSRHQRLPASSHELRISPLAHLPSGHSAGRLSYDALGRLTNVLDSASQSVSFGYDQNGNRIRVTDPNGHTWTNVFDELNRVIEQHNPDGTRTLFRYDPVGNLTNKVTPNGDSISYRYDALNRRTHIIYPAGSPVTFAYDAVGNQTNMTDGLGTTSSRYDDLNRLTSVTDPFGQTVQYGYDANGNRIFVTCAVTNTVRYGFDVLNRMVSVTNWLGGVIAYAYDNRGHLVATTNSNGTFVLQGYDDAGRLVALTNARPDGGAIAAYALALDAIGNHLQSAQQQPLYPILPSQTNIYIYNADNRLTSLDGQTVTHDLNGNPKAIGTNTAFAYDFEDRLVQFSVTNASGTCAYDGLGHRLSRTINGESARFVLDRAGALTQVLLETGTNGSPVAFYVYGLGLAQRIIPDGTVATYHFDIRGSTVALTDSAGNVTDAYAFDSFGVVANVEGDSPQPFRYLGRYGIMQDGNGLCYARARHFSPELGRFLTKDPLFGRDSDGQSLNRYVYALNNPILLVDVSGLSAQESQGIARYFSFGDFLIEASFHSAEEFGEYLLRLSSTDKGYRFFEELARRGHSIDFRGLGSTLRIAGRVFTVYSTLRGTADELQSRGITLSGLADAYRNIGANVAFGLGSRDALLNATTQGVTSATAFTINVFTIGLVNIHGEDLERLFTPNFAY